MFIFVIARAELLENTGEFGKKLPRELHGRVRQGEQIGKRARPCRRKTMFFFRESRETRRERESGGDRVREKIGTVRARARASFSFCRLPPALFTTDRPTVTRGRFLATGDATVLKTIH